MSRARRVPVTASLHIVCYIRMSACVYVCVDVQTQKHTHVYVFVCLHNMCAFVSFTNESGLQRQRQHNCSWAAGPHPSHRRGPKGRRQVLNIFACAKENEMNVGFRGQGTQHRRFKVLSACA